MFLASPQYKGTLSHHADHPQELNGLPFYFICFYKEHSIESAQLTFL